MPDSDEQHDLSDDSDYAASQQQELGVSVHPDSVEAGGFNVNDAFEIVYSKENVAVHPTQHAEERINGQLRLIKQSSSLFLRWVPYIDIPREGDSKVSLSNSIFTKDKQLYAIKDLPFSGVHSVHRHTPPLGWQYIIIVLSSGLAFPPLYFYNGGVREFLTTLKQHLVIVRSADDMNIFLVNDFRDPLQIMSSGGGDVPQKGKSPIKSFFSRKTKRNRAAPSPIITTTTTATASITTSTSLPSAPSPPPNPIAYTTPSPRPHLYPSAHTTPSPTVPHLYPSAHTTPSPTPPPNPSAHAIPSPTPPPNPGAAYYHHGYMMPGYYPPPPPPHNSGYMIPPHTCTPPPHPGAEEQFPVESRPYIEPAGDTFRPWRAPVGKIASIIKAKYDAHYLSWTKIPIAVRDMWFREFEQAFYWLPHHHEAIRRNFEKRGSARLCDYFNDARHAEQKPEWIGESIWAHLCDAWSKPDYVKVREQNKQNRGSDSGGLGSSLHTGGSIPHTEYRHRMKQVLGREPTPIELHIRTHQRKTDKQWVDSKAQKIHDDYMRIEEAHRHSSAGEGSSVRSDYDMWIEAAGGKKKGRVYGLGSQGKAHFSQSSGPSYPTYAQDQFGEMMRRQVAAFTEEMTQRMNENMAEMRRQIRNEFMNNRRGEEEEEQVDDEEMGTGGEDTDDGEDADDGAFIVDSRKLFKNLYDELCLLKVLFDENLSAHYNYEEDGNENRSTKDVPQCILSELVSLAHYIWACGLRILLSCGY